MRFFHRRAPAFPITQLVWIFPRTGACLDPAERQGLGRLTSRMLLTGAAGLGNAAFHRRLESLGATIGEAISNDHFSLRLVTLTRNLDTALDLLLSAVERPNLDPGEFARLQEELYSTWIMDREEHKNLRAQDVYMHRLYGGRPTGYRPDGTAEGLRHVSIEDVRAHYPRLFGGAEPILAVLSDLPRADVEARVLQRLQDRAPAGDGAPWPWDGFRPERPPGRRVTIVPDAHTETDEVLAGVFTTSEKDPDWHIHRLIALIFGGDMNARLFRVIRGERGYSYGAACWYESGHGHSPRDQVAPFTLYTFPSAEHTAEAAPLLVSLYQELVERGVDAAELERARRALIHSHAFLRDTPQKVLSLDCEEALYGVTFDDEATNREKISRITLEDVHRVLRETHHPESLTVVMLGDRERLEPLAERLPGVEEWDVLDEPPHPGVS